MGNIVLLMPTEPMRMDAHNYCQLHPEYSVTDIRCITTDTAVAEARRAKASGADLIVARGLQASLIQKYTDIPVVQMVITGQEMAILVLKAKNIARKERPVIAVVGITNMFCDMSYFNELYQVELRTYYAESDMELESVIDRAIQEQVDVIIGGERAVRKAFENHISSLFLATTDDSLSQALKMAQNVDHALTVEKRSAAEMETLLDYSYSGVVRLNSEGVIQSVNAALEQMVDSDSVNLVGQKISSIVPKFPAEELRSVLADGKENALIIEWNKVSLYMIMAPIIYGNHTDGAILTFHRTQKSVLSGKRKENGNMSLIPPVFLDDISHRSSAMKECVDLARLYAMSDRPLLLFGEEGTERRLIAQGIHNAGNRKNSPFLDVSCAGLSVEQQAALLFGERGAVMQTQGGTLLIQDVDALTIANQYRLYQLVRFHVINGTDVASLVRADVRVMVTSSRPLAELAEKQLLRKDLYYLLTGLELTVPPLRERPEDLSYYLDLYLKEQFQTYGRYHVLTAGARKLLMEYPWPGNLFQLERFCERQILTAKKRSIDEIAVSSLLNEMYGSEEEKSEDYIYEERKKEILNALRTYHGSRERTAEALGISTTTLWRQMKKYGIEMR